MIFNKIMSEKGHIGLEGQDALPEQQSSAAWERRYRHKNTSFFTPKGILITLTLVVFMFLLIVICLNLKEIASILSQQSMQYKSLVEPASLPPSSAPIASNGNTDMDQLKLFEASFTRHLKQLKESIEELAVAEKQAFLRHINSNQTKQRPQITTEAEYQHHFRGHDINLQHDHPKLVFPYPTVGVPIAGETFDFREMTFEELYEFQKQIATWFQPYNDTNCKYKRIGAEADGGYVVCENLISNSKALINIGVENRDKFGCDFTSYAKVPNYMYDCTSNTKPPCDTNNNQNYFFHSCVGEITEIEDKVYQTLKDMIDRTKSTGKRISLKIDAEGGEILALRYLPTSYLQNIDHIVMEYHSAVSDPGTPLINAEETGYRQERFAGNLQIFRTLSKYFHCVNWHFTTNRCYKRRPSIQNQHFFLSSTMELTLVNKDLLKLNSKSRSFAWSHNENNYNFGGPTDPMNDCQYGKHLDLPE